MICAKIKNEVIMDFCGWKQFCRSSWIRRKYCELSTVFINTRATSVQITWKTCIPQSYGILLQTYVFLI